MLSSSDIGCEILSDMLGGASDCAQVPRPESEKGPAVKPVSHAACWLGEAHIHVIG